MYVIVSYDIKASNCQKVLKILRKYLFHIHESLFEGEMTESIYFQMKYELMNVVKNGDDGSIICYFLPSNKVLKKEYIGKVETSTKYII